MADGMARYGFFGGVASLVTAACCVLPITFMLLGAGGAWVAVLASAAALSPYVITASSAVLAAAWILSLRRSAPRRTYALLGGGSLLTALAWIVLLNEQAMNDYLIQWM